MKTFLNFPLGLLVALAALVCCHAQEEQLVSPPAAQPADAPATAPIIMSAGELLRLLQEPMPTRMPPNGADLGPIVINGASVPNAGGTAPQAASENGCPDGFVAASSSSAGSGKGKGGRRRLATTTETTRRRPANKKPRGGRKLDSESGDESSVLGASGVECVDARQGSVGSSGGKGKGGGSSRSGAITTVVTSKLEVNGEDEEAMMMMSAAAGNHKVITAAYSVAALFMLLIQ